MRRSISFRVAVFSFVILTALPLAAAPTRNRNDRSTDSFIARIIRIIKNITAMEDARPTFPLPGTTPTTT